MSSLTTYSKGKLHDLLLRGVAYTAPTTVYLALFTNATADAGTGTEVTGGAYARQTVAFGALDGTATGANSAQVQFPLATAGYTVVDWAVFDAVSGGNMLLHGPFLDPLAITTGQRLTVQLGELGVVWG